MQIQPVYSQGVHIWLLHMPRSFNKCKKAIQHVFATHCPMSTSDISLRTCNLETASWSAKLPCMHVSVCAWDTWNKKRFAYEPLYTEPSLLPKRMNHELDQQNVFPLPLLSLLFIVCEYKWIYVAIHLCNDRCGHVIVRRKIRGILKNKMRTIRSRMRRPISNYFLAIFSCNATHKLWPTVGCRRPYNGVNCVSINIISLYID